MPNSKRPRSELLPPNASAMVESMRAHGYTLSTAIADLVDNSISAGASTVWIDVRWDGSKSWIAVSDDGRGMTEAQLSQAMRLGSQSPLVERGAADLGRFGLGLKTASFSQCRRLTVFSKPEGAATSVRRWDLDHLADPRSDGWELLLEPHPDSHADVDRIESVSSGTTVLWEALDRIVPSQQATDESMRKHFFAQVAALEEQLGMVFHRYLDGARPLIILLNEQPITLWDPFARRHSATTKTPEEALRLPGQPGTVRVKGYVLPHRDKLTDQDHRELGGPKGWNAQQGFYLYRNDRLIVAGSWLGLGSSRPWTQEEHYKLARIELDVPNSLDHAWQLDVKKSHATPPPQLRDHLLGLAQNVRIQAREVYRHRGKYMSSSKSAAAPVRAWKRGTRRGQAVYMVDRSHPIVAAVLHRLDTTDRQHVDVMLKIIEETVPVEQIWIDTAETPDGHRAPFSDTTTSELRRAIRRLYTRYRRFRWPIARRS